MAARRLSKHHKPLLPGLWSLLFALALAAGIIGFYAALGHFTAFERLDPSAAAVEEVER